jgi:hypothetical protein
MSIFPGIAAAVAAAAAAGGAAATPTNQYGLAPWTVSGNAEEPIVSLQLLGVSAAYLAIYRVNNPGDGTSNAVSVKTDHGQFPLLPGTSIDVSTQTVSIVGRGGNAHGIYQLLCCATATAAGEGDSSTVPFPRPQPPPK